MAFMTLCSCINVNTVGPAVPDYTASANTNVPATLPPTAEVPTATPEPTFTPEPTVTPAPIKPPAPPVPTIVPFSPSPETDSQPSAKPYYYNDYPTSENERALAEAGKSFMKMLRSDPEYSELDLTTKEGYPYLICINSVQNCITVYCADEQGHYTRPYLSMVCSAGKRTPMGIYNTKEHYYWHVLMGPCYGQYCTRIVNGILFHSVPYNTLHKYDLRYRSYNRLGTWASHGCIRLATNDSKWIFDNCRSGTTVVIYNQENDPGPLGKPEPIKLDANEVWLRGWDPTDPDKHNPWGTEYMAGTTHRSALAQSDYNYAIEHGIWDGTINPSEPATSQPTEEPSITPDPSDMPSPTPGPSPEIPTEPPEPTPAPTATPSEVPIITPKPTDEPTPVPDTPTPDPTDAPPETEAPGSRAANYDYFKLKPAAVQSIKITNGFFTRRSRAGCIYMSR